MVGRVLSGGYVAPNILKWHWWRFNSYGYFAGMIAGVGVALLAAVVRTLDESGSIRAIHTLPFTLLASIVASIFVCRRTPPEPDDGRDGARGDGLALEEAA